MPEGRVLAKNKKAYFDYEILEKYETGIILKGAEVKSIKGGHIQLKGSYIMIADGKVFTENLHISPYRYAPLTAFDPLRRRELMLKRKEIAHLVGLTAQKGFTLIPLEIFLKNNLIKILLGVCRGKKQHDKRQVLKKRAMTKEIHQGLRNL